MSKVLFSNGIRITRRGVISTAIGAGLLAGGILGGCGFQKAVEPFNDSPISYKLDSPALVGSMPDGFNNWASKCVVNGIRIAVIYHGDADRGSVALVQDPNCKVPSSAYSRISGGTP